ncbi:hypothetical protein [Leptothoe sp. PORK10 BA2]|uniref:hypothetical protein n=1 Tax=Leptothoe sp. PORK10 BA2 TaxID=3110254 RepID=UPI002B20DD35|nr:hypothetical protein [Leptothoe sp. PORK10 BA2]MEA5464470.1 hypothetical protein [Leptothoe sp. PORK10 BA2]
MKRYNYSPLLLLAVIVTCVACGKTSDAAFPPSPTQERGTLTDGATKTVSGPLEDQPLGTTETQVNLLKSDDGALSDGTAATDTTVTVGDTKDDSKSQPDDTTAVSSPNDLGVQESVNLSDNTNNVISDEPQEPRVEVAEMRIPAENEVPETVILVSPFLDVEEIELLPLDDSVADDKNL